jgi:Siphovirus ReqiPepy6 Gp37-like protein
MSRMDTNNQYMWYTLDASLRRDQVIEGFKSFIWTERYSAAGDVTIVIKSTYANRSLLAPGTMIGKEGSTYVMVVDTIDDDTDTDGTRLINVTGQSFEAFLNQRVAMPALANLAETPAWVLTGTPGDIARQMFNEICIFLILSSKDSFPYCSGGTYPVVGNLPEPDTIITVALAPNTLYNSIKSVCDTYGLGFRIIKDGDNGQVFFQVYVGNDRTSEQTVYNAVIFAPELDNLSQIRQLTSNALVKTTAYVFAQNGAATVDAPTADPDATGGDRKILFVNSSNSADAGPDLTAALQAEGLIALANQRTVYSFDGQLPPDVSYIYGRDYGLGDLVEEKTEAGFGNLMIVTEQIFVSDDQGNRSYPTLSIFQSIVPGSWAGYGTDTWAGTSTSLKWSDL